MIQWLWLWIVEIWKVIEEASLFLLFGFLVAGALHYWVPAKRVYQLLGKRKFSSILLASLIGIPLPLCSCSVIPTAVALRKRGATKGATVSFLISTPETGVDSIALTYALIDLPMTIFRPIAALITALVAGLATEVFGRNDEGEGAAPVATPGSAPESCEHCPVEEATDEGQHNHLKAIEVSRPASYWGSFWDIFDDIAWWLTLGLALAGLISVALPSDLLERYLGTGLWPMLAALAVSVPLYVCAASSTPIAAALMAKGLSPGAALVLLLAGPATNIATIVVLWKFLGRRGTLIYLISIVAVSLLLGVYIDSYYQYRQIDPKAIVAQPLEWIPGWLQTLTALVFLGFMARSLWRTPPPAEMRSIGSWLGTRPGLTFMNARRAVILLIVLFLVAWLLTGFLIVKPGETGIVKRFGGIIRSDLAPGLHLHWPAPIETGEVCDRDSVRTLQIGFTQKAEPGGVEVFPTLGHRRFLRMTPRTQMLPMQPIEKEAYLLTGDQNEIDIQAEVQYRVADPVRFLYGLEEPDRLVRDHTISVLVEFIGRNKVDEVYTFLRAEIEQEATRRLQGILAEQKTGIEFLGLYLVNVHAPPEVHAAFRDLASAREDRSRSMNDAQGLAAKLIYSASGEAAQALGEAEASRQEQVLLAEGASEAYLNLLKEYEMGPRVMTSRLLYETYENTLPGARLYLGIDRAQLGFWRWETGQLQSIESRPEPTPQRVPTLEEILSPPKGDQQ